MEDAEEEPVPAKSLADPHSLPPINILDADAVVSYFNGLLSRRSRLKSPARLQQYLLKEEGGDCNEYTLNVHHRHVREVAPNAWRALPTSKTAQNKQVPKLRSLDLSFNALELLDVHVFAPLAELRELRLYSNKLTDQVASSPLAQARTPPSRASTVLTGSRKLRPRAAESSGALGDPRQYPA
jgi:hypothetical protein